MSAVIAAVFRRPLFRLLVCVPCLYLAACVSPGSSPEATVSEADRAEQIVLRDADLLAFDRFEVRGGLGFWNDDLNQSARIVWRQREALLDVQLDAPLGLGSARLTSNEAGARLTRGAKGVWNDRSAGRLLQRVLGLDAEVPIEQLSLWMRGLPGDAVGIERDEQGRLLSLRWRDEAGMQWRARIRRYTLIGARELPSLVTARGAGYNIRLVLKDWRSLPNDVKTDTGSEEAHQADIREHIPADKPAIPEADDRQGAEHDVDGKSSAAGGGRLRIPGR